MFFQAENKLRPLTLPPPTCLNFYSSIPSIRVVWMFSVNPTIDQMQLCICCLLWLQIVFLTTVRRIVTMHSRKKINRTSKGFAQTYLSPRDNSAMYLGFLEKMLMKKLKIYVFYSTLLFFTFQLVDHLPIQGCHSHLTRVVTVVMKLRLVHLYNYVK